MIGTFWNLCRACPSMPVDKLHSEYRSTYRWHEYTGPHQEVVRRAPQGVAAPFGEKASEIRHTSQHEESSELPKLEPALPRRKKHPDLAYRRHEFLAGDGGTVDGVGTSNLERARSEERSGMHSRMSRRSKSEGPARGNVMENGDERRRDSDPDLDNMGRDTGLLRKAISKINTEYRMQFAWPQGHTSRRDAAGLPKKSQSMGVINHTANGITNRKHFDQSKYDHELEPLVNDHNDKVKEDQTEYKKKFLAFSRYDYNEGRFTKRDDIIEEVDAPVNMSNGLNSNNEAWYQEVMELRKKAGEYKNRGWGSELAPEKLTDIYNKQFELWDQVSRRSSLSALSLASTTYRAYTKEEKDQENTKKSSPTKARMMRDIIRHHLERTTGGSEFDGLILSPTREKLEPTLPRNDDPRGSQKNSPKKNSPQKIMLQKRNLQKIKNATQTATVIEQQNEKRSPKRQSRSVTAKDRKNTSGNDSLTRRPRPSSLNTTASSRSKSSSSVPSKTEEDRIPKAKANKLQSNDTSTKDRRRKGHRASDTTKEKTEPNETPVVAEPENNVPLEPVVKSPPEPTRVKSPEQILMRSPDPVNWTVPLDTGKMFTVTQNVREGDIIARPHSEVKAWTPPDSLPPVAQSAPPELSEQTKDTGMGLAVKV